MRAPAEPTWRAIASSQQDSAAETTRVQLGWIALLIVIAILPHVRAAPLWITASVAGALGWRIGAASFGWKLPGKLLRGLLTLGGAFAVAASFRRISGLDAGSALLILMLALKLLETRSSRDRSIVILIAWFVLFAGFLREQSLVSVPQLAAGIIAGIGALLQSTRSHVALSPARGLLLTGRLLGHALPLALALFLLFPRLPGPFWAVPAGGGEGRTGLTDQLSPGDITSLARSDEVAFRVRFDGQAPIPALLYWRGPVLERFDGRRWQSRRELDRRTAVAYRHAPALDRNTRLHGYELTLEPHGQRWLLPLETSIGWSIADASMSDSFELRASRPVDRRIAWRGRSVAGGAFREAALPDELNRQLPATGNPRTRALASAERAAASSDRDYLLRILQRFRNEPFHYTLQPPALGAQSVDDFLFRTRSGFCEHYASAFAVLARAAGIPARIVAGYQGGERNPVGNYWIVRQSDAHAWVEVWLDGRWLRFDPTAAVAPSRIEHGIEAALPEVTGDSMPLLLGDTEWLERIALRWDAVNATWDRWVLAFGPEQQSDLLEGLGFESPSTRDIAIACAATFSVLLLLFTWISSRQPARGDPLEQAWQKLSRRLERYVAPRAPAEGPGEFASRVAAERPEIAGAVRALAAEYLRLRYERLPTAEDVRRFRRQVSGLELRGLQPKAARARA